MDGSANKPTGSRTKHLRYDDEIVEEVYKLGRSERRAKQHSNSRCIVCEDAPPDTDVTVAESQVIPLRTR